MSMQTRRLLVLVAATFLLVFTALRVTLAQSLPWAWWVVSHPASGGMYAMAGPFSGRTVCVIFAKRFSKRGQCQFISVNINAPTQSGWWVVLQARNPGVAKFQMLGPIDNRPDCLVALDILRRVTAQQAPRSEYAGDCRNTVHVTWKK